MDGSRVRLPPSVNGPFDVFVNGVAQTEGVDYERHGRVLEFSQTLIRAERLGLRHWLIGAFGIGTYRRDDSVDVRYTVGGQPRLAERLDIEPSG